MGIVIRQSFWNSIFIYSGLVVGYINSVLIFPFVLTPEEYGLTRVLVSLTLILSQLGLLGTPTIIIRFFHNFFDPEGKHYGFITWTFGIAMTGLATASIILFFSKSVVIGWYADKSVLFEEYFYFLFPMLSFMVLHAVFGAYLSAIKKTTFQSFVKEVLIRVLQMIAIGLFYMEVIDFNGFVWCFVGSYLLSFLSLLIYSLFEKDIIWGRVKYHAFPVPRGKLIHFGFFNFLSNVGGNIAAYVDVLMIGAILLTTDGESSFAGVATYTVTMFIANIISIPGRSISAIAIALVAESFAKNKRKELEDLYQKTALVMLVLGLLILIGILVNAHNLNQILPPEYQGGFMLLAALCFTKLVDYGTGINTTIISHSPHYRVTSLLMVLLIAFIVVTNWLLIPVYGLAGAALATLISSVVFNTIKFLFLLKVYRMQPFTWRTMVVLMLGGMSFGIVHYILPVFDHLFLDITLRSIFICVLYIPPILLLKLVPEMNNVFGLLLRKIRLKL